MTILVTGAAGFVGNTTVRRLAEIGRPVRAVVRNLEKAEKRLAGVKDRIEIVECDVSDSETMATLMHDVTAVIHLAAIAIEKGPRTYEAVNYRGTVNVVDAANRAGVERFINMSQNGADSSSPYPFLQSKGRAQNYVAESARNWTALRPSSIFGPRDEFFNSIARLVRLTPVVFPLIGGGEARFQPVSVDDVVEAIVRSLDDDSTIGKKLDLGGPEVLTMAEIEHRILRALDSRRFLFPAPTWLLRIPVAVMEHTLPGSPVSSGLLDLLALDNVTRDNALIEHFRMQPRPFDGEHVAYLRENTVARAIDKLIRG